MAKWQLDSILDQSLLYISANVVEIYVCSGQPANYAGIAAVALTGAAIPTFTGPVNGDVSGRKLTINSAVDMPITTSGNATHVVLASALVLLYVTTATLQSLTAGGTVTTPVWDIEIADAA